MLKSFLSEIKDNRRKEGKRYKPGDILLFSIFAIHGGAVSHRKIHTFIKGHYEVLNEKFGHERKRLPAYTTIRNIIIGLYSDESEECFRKYSLKLSGSPELSEEKNRKCFIACDGKVLRGSSDNFNDKKAIQILSVFLQESGIIPAYYEADEKTDEIPAAQQMMSELGLENCIFTYDAINCQEKTLKAAEESNNDVIVCVKGNQKILLNNCKDTCELGLPCSDMKSLWSEKETEQKAEKSRFSKIFL
ncbi:MAG: hypothetical protein BWK80_45640 [Desulfobacteraceae bacterium IS3]|jgi:predicted transposase YbfD/YdcC|nr:MAG: hypothetical protein BWK80_45640 [Desulfobacteraceae bacterium IS3]